MWQAPSPQGHEEQEQKIQPLLSTHNNHIHKQTQMTMCTHCHGNPKRKKLPHVYCPIGQTIKFVWCPMGHVKTADDARVTRTDMVCNGTFCNLAIFAHTGTIMTITAIFDIKLLRPAETT